MSGPLTRFKMAEVPEWVTKMIQNQEQALSIMQQQLAQSKEEIKFAKEETKEANKTIHELISKLSNQSLFQPQAAMHQVDGYSILMRDLTPYSFDPEDESTVFKAWFQRHKDEIETIGAKLSDEEKRNIVVRKLDSKAYQTYADSLLPKEPREFSLDETVKNLEKLFSSSKTLLRRRFEFLNLQCLPLTPSSVPFTDYMNNIKRTGEDAIVKDMNSETLQSLLFILGLKDGSLSQIRENLIRKINSLKEGEEVPKIEDLTGEANRMAASRVDSHSIGDKPYNVRYVQERHRHQEERRWTNRRSRSPTPNRNVRFDRSPSPRKDSHTRRSSSPKRTSQHQQYGNKTSHKRTYRGKPEYNQKSVAAVKKEQQLGPRKTVVNVEIRAKQIKLLLDTGSDITIMSKRNWQKLGQPRYEDTTAQVKAVNGSPVRIYGTFSVDFRILSHGKKWITGTGLVYISDEIDILGIDWCMQLPEYKTLHSTYHVRSIAKEDIDPLRLKIVSELKSNYPGVFEPGLGKCSKAIATLQLIQNATPIFRNKRPVPYAYQESVDKELDRLCSEQVLSPVDHANWAAPIVVVRKANGKVRVCADFSTGLNDALMLHQHPLPTTEDVFNKLCGGQLFSQIDLADAYLQIEMDKKSSEYVTVNTHRGLYRYNRLPFGVKSAPGIFQQIMDKMTVGLRGVVAYLDDIIITGRNHQEHRQNLNALFDRIQSYGLRVRIEKCNFLMQKLKFLGHIISAEGRRMDPEKTRAITNMPEPENKQQVKSFLGMISYYGAFVPEMRKYRGPLDELLKQDKPFEWSKECQTAYQELKKVLTSDLLLMHFDPKLPIIVAADASQYGIGAVLLQKLPDGHIKAVSHASKSLTAAEKRYGQIEKEGLALIYAVRKFHRYIYGRQFSLWTDHKPLLAIYGSKHGLPATSVNRLARWALILKAYNFTIEYKRTTEFGQADALSRLIAETVLPEEDIVIAQTELETEHECRAIVAELPLSLNSIASETKNDTILTQVIDCVTSGSWPSKPDSALARYQSLSASLSVYHKCLVQSNRVVIPQALQQRVLKTLHDGHPGSERMKKLAKCYVFWPNMTKDITEYVKHCESCQKSAKLPVKTELCSWPKPSKPWSRIHIDYAGPLNGKSYLVVVDAYSKWPEVFEMTSTTSSKTMECLTKLFAQFGNPETLVSDNGTQFTSSEFKSFCELNGINHIRSPPFHPQSNGQAERFVDTLKRSLAKDESLGAKNALQVFLQTYRYTPCESSPEGKSPAENFLGRQIRNKLTLLKNSTPEMSEIRDTDMENQYNRHHKAKNREFKANDSVWVKTYRGNKDFWNPGVVISKKGNTTYEVDIDGQTHHRHANQIRFRLDATSIPGEPELSKSKGSLSSRKRKSDNAKSQQKAYDKAKHLAAGLGH